MWYRSGHARAYPTMPTLGRLHGVVPLSLPKQTNATPEQIAK